MPTFIIRKQDGSIQYAASDMTVAYRGHGTVATQSRYGGNTNPSSALIPIPSTGVIVAVRAVGFTAARAGVSIISGQTYLNYACSCSPGPSLDYWVFDQTAALAAAGVGLTMRDSTGRVTYSSTLDVMRLAGVVTGIGNSGSFPAGSTYAAVAQSWAGHRKAGETLDYQSGSPQLWDGQSPSSDFREQNDGKVYGTRFDGTTLYLEEVSWDDVLVSMGSNPVPAPDWETDIGSVLVVDVTGLA